MRTRSWAPTGPAACWRLPVGCLVAQRNLGPIESKCCRNRSKTVYHDVEQGQTSQRDRLFVFALGAGGPEFKSRAPTISPLSHRLLRDSPAGVLRASPNSRGRKARRRRGFAVLEQPHFRVFPRWASTRKVLSRRNSAPYNSFGLRPRNLPFWNDHPQAPERFFS